MEEKDKKETKCIYMDCEMRPTYAIKEVGPYFGKKLCGIHAENSGFLVEKIAYE